MKKLLLILLCLPMIGFGQDDCGKKPVKPFNKSGKDYKEYKIKYDKWLECKEKADSNALYKYEFPIDEKTGLITFEEVIKTPGKDKNQLYAIYREWYVNFFRSADDVLQMDDKENGVLIGKGFQDITFKVIGMNLTEKLYYKVKFILKDGRFKYVISDLQTQQYPYQGNSSPNKVRCEVALIDLLYSKRGKINKINRNCKEAVLTAVLSLIDNIKNSSNKAVLESEDDW